MSVSNESNLIIKLLLLIIYLQYYFTNQEKIDDLGYDLPPFHLHLIKQTPFFFANTSIPNDTFIPRNAWIAVRDSHDIPKNILEMMHRNANWNFHLCDNNCKDNFMEKLYANTSILWAYNMLNPIIGTSKVEIWRLCVLYAYGGMYMDDDAIVASPLNDIIENNKHKLIVGQEGYNWTDNCFQPNYILSNYSLNQKFNELNNEIYFNNKYFLNWLMFSEPFHIIIERTIIHVIELIKAEYLCESLIKMSKKDHRGKLLMCATTFPITLSAREILLERKYNQTHSTNSMTVTSNLNGINRTDDIGLYVASHNFHEFGGNMKAWLVN